MPSRGPTDRELVAAVMDSVLGYLQEECPYFPLRVRGGFMKTLGAYRIHIQMGAMPTGMPITASTKTLDYHGYLYQARLALFLESRCPRTMAWSCGKYLGGQACKELKRLCPEPAIFPTSQTSSISKTMQDYCFVDRPTIEPIGLERALMNMPLALQTGTQAIQNFLTSWEESHPPTNKSWANSTQLPSPAGKRPGSSSW